ncbi:OmpA family protein [Yangia mangrovi]|uniref:Cell envelope biogenesis protein OmpA n=1 Tax=Alloyangia mangrovi TaxID=1779329 RepID=A0A2A3JXS2_9RHOB|nr:OmpA family protein [Alloyangia mangrovi]MCA0939677.1 OmpA family protein [Alloyangia pacifica]MCA0944817.1 OmpA family protein [Alloyangia pacifica]MCT4371658.1 OmpA family protein [Alloyangia mangrovi]
MTTTTRRRAERLLPGVVLALVAALPAQAFELALPGSAKLAEERITDPGSYAVPVAPWTEMEGLLTDTVEGRIQRQAWRIEATGLTVLQIMAPLRAQLEEAGWEILLDCAARACGGFDFRFATEVMRGPAMYVDLSSYRYLSARSPEGAYLTLLVSRSPAAGFVQVIRASVAAPAGIPSPEAAGGTEPVIASSAPDLIQTLEAQGHAVLGDLTFASGADELEPGDIASLDALADYLAADPARRVLFVGHTDATGSVAANVEISRRRARAARSYLLERGVPESQMEADGAGYLSPIASNLTDAGREENRRVEVVLLPAVE